MLKEFIASDMINVRHYIQKQNALGVPGTFAESSMIRTTAIHTTCLRKITNEGEGNLMRASFGEVASKFNR